MNMKSAWGDERGAVYPLVVFLLPVILVMAGLLIDVGMGVYQHTKLMSATDSAAIAALDAYDEDKWEDDEEIELDTGKARRLAANYLDLNMDGATLDFVKVDDNQVEVKAEKNAELFVMSMFGKEDFDLDATAHASLDDDEDDNDDED